MKRNSENEQEFTTRINNSEKEMKAILTKGIFNYVLLNQNRNIFLKNASDLTSFLYKLK